MHEKSQNHNEMTERSGSGNGAEVWKLVKDISRCLVCNRGYGEGRAHDESRGNENSEETTRFKSVTWKTSEKKTTHEEQIHGSSYKYVEIEMDQGTKTNRDDHRLKQGLQRERRIWMEEGALEQKPVRSSSHRVKKD